MVNMGRRGSERLVEIPHSCFFLHITHFYAPVRKPSDTAVSLAISDQFPPL